MDILQKALEGPCISNCNGEWLEVAEDTLTCNNLTGGSFQSAVRELLEKGRGKYRNILTYGSANCGKTFLLNQGWIQSSSSDLQKSLKFFPNLISQLFIAVHEINYPSCFIVYYEIKQRRNYSVDHTANPAPPERIGRVSICAVSSFVDTLENSKARPHKVSI